MIMKNVETGKMKNYRLTTVTHSEIVQSLPLPSLGDPPGDTDPGLLYDDEATAARLRRSGDTAALSQVERIVDLLRATDTSYLSLRNAGKQAAPRISVEEGSLLEAVLLSEPDAFTCALPIPGRRRSSRNSTTPTKVPEPVVPQAESRAAAVPKAAPYSAVKAQPVAAQRFTPHSAVKVQPAAVPQFTPHSTVKAQPVVSSPVDAPTSSRKTRMQRKHPVTTQRDDDLKNVNGEGDAVYVSLCEVLDELFERTDVPGEDEGEEGGTFLSLSDMKMLAEEVVNVRAKNALHQVPSTYFIKLLSLLDRHVQIAFGRDVDDEYSENYSLVISALEAVQISLLIMTVPSMTKQLYKEEIIDRMIELSRYHMIHSVFGAYDPVYRQSQKQSAGDVDDDDDGLDYEDVYENGGGPAKRARKGSKAKKAASSKISSSTSTVFSKLCIILGLLKDLLTVECLLDSIVLQLTKTVLSTLAVDNIQLMQLKSIGVACVVFDVYPQHRGIIFDEIISLVWKLPTSKRSLRAFQLQDEEQPGQIQMLTAMLLQLIQCCVTLPKIEALAAEAPVGSSTPEKPATTVKCFEPAMEWSMYFWKTVMQRWAAPKTQDGTDIKAVVENMVVDLLTTLNVPEFPASSLSLQMLCIILLGPGGAKAKDALVRGAAIDLLGQIAARLKQDAVSSSRETLWLLQDMLGKGDAAEQEVMTKTCVVCREDRKNQVMLSCDACNRWFHGDCLGVSGHDMLGRGWFCQFCICKRQLDSLRSDVNPQMVGGPSLPRNKKVEETSSSKTGITVAQQMLLNSLKEAAVSDGMATYAHRFYLCQWYREESSQGMANLQLFHARSASKALLQDFGSMHAQLSRSAIVRISLALGQLRPVARNFDRLLERLLASLQENAPTPRAKALRAVSAMVEVYPDVLGDERVQRAVEGRFLDSAISVREAAMELVGRHIVSRPDFAVKYFEKISERIKDTGVSVRKRVIKIIRDVCMSNAGFEKATDGCLRIISRIHDEESSIQDLVGKTFYELWFEEPSVQSTQYVTGGSVVPLEIAERTQQLVDVLRSLPNNLSMVTIIKRCLALDFCPPSMKNAATSSGTLLAVRHRCELMCKSLLESILKVEESTTEEVEIRALPHIMALHAFCTVDPTLCAPASDPSRYIVTLLPYLKTQVDSRDAAQLLQSIVFVIDAVLPLLRRPPESLVAELERDLRQLILRYSFLTVVYACIKCLCSMTKVAVKGVNSFSFLVGRFFKSLQAWRQEYGPTQKPTVLRYLFCLGALVRYGSELVESMDDSDISLQQILGLYKHYMVSEDFSVKARALQAVGYVFIAKPDFMMEQEMGILLRASLSLDAHSQMKIQALRNFSEYLLDVEQKMGTSESVPETVERSQPGKAVPVAAGAGDSNICGGIIQVHWEQILERCLDSDVQVRQNSLKVVETVLRQGLVHPMTCIPMLIAMEVDHQETNAKLAHRLLHNLIEKYPAFFESRFGDGLQLSFSFIQSGAAASSSTNSSTTLPVGKNSSLQQATAKVTAKFAKGGISRIYKLIRPSRVSRNKFLSSVIRKFDTAASGTSSSIPFLVYCTEVLSALPFGLPDEPLYIVYSINRVVQVRGGVLESNLKAGISDGQLGVVAKQVLSKMALDREVEGNEAYDMNATEEIVSTGPVEREDDTEGIPEEALEKLGVDCNSAMALALLLRLKRHLKIIYSLSDARCQAFSPTETIKATEVLSKRESMKEFSTQELPVDPPSTVRQMLEQYQAFKRLLKEDAMDYSAYIATIPAKKRGRSAANNGDAGQPGQAHPITPTTRTLRKKKPKAVIADESASEPEETPTLRKKKQKPVMGESPSEPEDDDSEEWDDKDKKRNRSVGSAVRGSGSRRRSCTVQNNYTG